MEGGLPTGTVTFLFTDIEGSTRRWEMDPDAMRVALAVHDEALRAAIVAEGGWVFKHTGDGVCAAFATAPAAVRAAVAAQTALQLPVRMGIGTGEAELRGDDYFGPPLNVTARVMSVGHGGQILVAESAATLSSDLDLLDLGEHRLRDLGRPQRLFQVCAPGLRTEFPALRTLDAAPSNLPAQTTSFVGREREVTDISRAIREHRLVTLTGVGGVGKTRLAVHVAAELLPEFADGVFLVELADLGDPDAVPSALATALGITPQATMSVFESVVESFASRRALLVLDNCEHLLEASAQLVEALLKRSTSAKVLATSRESLRLPGEHVWAVPSLETRDGTRSAALELFVERARAVNADFSLAEDFDASAVAEICERLDGIALAIELAAARMVSMTPGDVRDRLDDRFRLLAGGRRGLERHQTLRHAVQWSYELLDDDERLVLNRCAVFAGGFDLVAVRAISGAGEFDEYQLLDLLDSLVRKSLLSARGTHGRMRYGMLETIRQFAEEQLAASGTVAETRDRHARHFAEEAELNCTRWATPEQPDVYRWYGSELANLRSGFRWAIGRHDIDTAAAIAGKVGFWAMYYESFEPYEWCMELLDVPGIEEHRLLRWIYVGAAAGAWLGRPRDAIAYGQASVALDPGHFDPVPHQWDETAIGLGHLFAGEPEKWLEIARTVADNADEDLVGWPTSVVWGLATLGHYDEAISSADVVVADAESRGIPWEVAYAYSAYAKAFTMADPARALEAHRMAVRVARESGNRMFEVVFSRELAPIEAAHGDVATALDSFDEIIDTCHKVGDLGNLTPTLGYLVVFLDRIDRPRPASILYGAATQHAAALGMVTELAATAEHLRDSLGDDSFEECVREGAAFDVSGAVGYAHDIIDSVRSEVAESS